MNFFTKQTINSTLYRGHEVDFRLAISPEKIKQTIATVKPDFTICPFLQQKIPDDVCQNHMCMVFHPGTQYVYHKVL
jgi:hypothetical protein